MNIVNLWLKVSILSISSFILQEFFLLNECNKDMNITFGRKTRLAYLGSFFFLLTLIACEKKDISFGEQFAESYTNIVLIDTVTPQLSTYKLDSFSTSGSGTLITGSFNDVAFGSITARSYFQLGIPSFFAQEIPSTAIYDSLTFILKPDDQYYGDTTIAQTISVHELTSTLAFAPEKTQFYNTTSFPYNPTPLGSKTFNPQPKKMDSLEIRLPDVKGNELFTKLKTKSTDVTNQENFLRYFKGLAVVSSPTPAALLSFKVSDSALCMRVYYHEMGATGIVKRYIQFPVTNSHLQFNQLTINRAGTPIAGLPNGFSEVPASATGHAAYMQYATGLFGKITFPSLHNLLNIDKAGKILKAELIIKPLAGSFNKEPYRIPSQLYLGRTDNKNNTGGLITDVNGIPQSGNLVIDDLFGENTNYSYDVTAFLQQQIFVNEAIREGLVIYSPSTSTFNRLILGDETTGKSRIQLKIYYLVVD